MSAKMWSVSIDGEQNVITLKKTKAYSAKLNVNGVDMDVPRSYYGGFATGEMGYSFQIGSHQLFLSIQQGAFVRNFSLYCDGLNVETGAPYVQASKMPAWNWIFVVLNALIIFLGGGILGALVGFIAVYTTHSLSRNAKYSVGARVAMCLGVTILAWVLYFVFAIAIVSMYY